MSYRIPFNRPHIAGRELHYIAHAVTHGQIAADGIYTRRCTRFLEERFDIHHVLLTSSCTASLEMAVVLCGIGPGDEVIMPSYTFVSAASAVARVGAQPVFVDIRKDTLNIDETLIEAAISPRTRAIIPVHYAGVACNMTKIMDLAERYNLRVIEDAAHGVNAFYKDRALGSIGHFGTYSFHETKNVICGEGGALCVNDAELEQAAEIIRDKGTNRRAFFRGEVDKYTWVELGSSYVPSEVSAAFLWAQLEEIENITKRRREIYQRYLDELSPLESRGLLRLPIVPDECKPNYHMFYVLLPTPQVREALMSYLKAQDVLAVFHYVPLHSSPAGLKYGTCRAELPVTDDLSGRLLRLPFYHEITRAAQEEVAGHIECFLSGFA